MNNMSMRKILLFSFGAMVTIVVLLNVLSFKAINSSKDSILEIGRVDKITADITEIEKLVLETINLSCIYDSSKDKNDLQKYKKLSNDTMSYIDKILPEVLDKDIKTDLSELKTLNNKIDKMVENGEKFENISSLQKNTMHIIDGLYKKAIKIQKAIEKKDENTIFYYKTVITTFAIIAIILAIILAFWVSNFISKNLQTIQEAADELSSSDGDLTKRLPVIGENEIGLLAKSVNNFIKKVQDTIHQAKENGVENASVSAELSATALEIGGRAENESRLVGDTSNRAQEVFQKLQDSIEVLNSGEKDVEAAMTTLSKVNVNINRLLSNMDSAGEKELELSQSMSQLEEEANSVKEVLSIIGDIADQTNLLALNAAIEAARAGEHGRGFAVVADEVRNLAERTQKSLTEITGTINLVIQSVNDASAQMRANTEEFSKAMEEANQVDREIKSVNDALKEAANASTTSARTSEEISKEMQEVIDNMKNITEISADNARSVEEIAGAAEHLSRLTEELRHTLELFKS